jgi:septum site-determining protein MinC
MQVVGVSGCKSGNMKTSAELAGLPILTEGKWRDQGVLSLSQSDESVPHAKTLIIDRPVRSGQLVYARRSDLVVVSNVSAGAELVADGSIHVYGTMRGRALAGASNDHSSQIFCTKMAAELVSIAGEYWVMDQISTRFFGKAARVYLSENGLNIHNLS